MIRFVPVEAEREGSEAGSRTEHSRAQSSQSLSLSFSLSSILERRTIESMGGPTGEAAATDGAAAARRRMLLAGLLAALLALPGGAAAFSPASRSALTAGTGAARPRGARSAARPPARWAGSGGGGGGPDRRRWQQQQQQQQRRRPGQPTGGLFASGGAQGSAAPAGPSPGGRLGAARRLVARKAAGAKERLRSVLAWERRKRRGTLAAAALVLSALLFSVTGGGGSGDTAGAMAVAAGAGPGGGPAQPQAVRVVLASDAAAASRSVVHAVRRGGEEMVGGAAGAAGTSLLARKPPPRTPPPMAAALGNAKVAHRTVKEAIAELKQYMSGPKSDTLILLLATSLVTPLCKKVGVSPILGFLSAGMLLGPNALHFISDLHSTEALAELGIVFFLFEMGLELSLERLKSMRRDVFGLGLSQFLGTAAAVMAIGRMTSSLPGNALVVLGGGLALSSSAFVLQLLKDKSQLATRFGKASFGILLFQDLAVVPLLVVTPILAGGGQGMAAAVGSAIVKAVIALSGIAFVGRVVLNPLFNTVAQANTQEAFLGVTLFTVLSMSFLTEGLGLSNTLGAFLAGVLLSETKYRYQIEADIAPFRGVLLGLFFVTVGFEIDVMLVLSQLPAVASTVFGILAVKATIAALFCLAFGLTLATSVQAGLMISQAGEFAFVAFGLARNLGILDTGSTKFLLTCVSLTMAITPAMTGVGAKIAKRLEEGSDFTHYLGQDSEASELKESDDFVIVIGYGTVGKVVCDLLDRKFIKYIGLEVNPSKAIDARNRGLPVFYGDIVRQEVADAFNAGNAKAIVVTIADKAQANRAIIALRRMFPEVKIFARAKDADHAQRLQKTLDVAAMVPIIPEDNTLLTLPFGGAVLRSLGAAPEEVNAILEATRKDVLMGRGLAKSEEETTLMQLGILAEEEVEENKMVVDVEVTNEDGIQSDKPTIAAEAAVEDMQTKSPMVAQLIEASIVTPTKKDHDDESQVESASGEKLKEEPPSTETGSEKQLAE